MVVYDVTDRESFEGIKNWMQEIEKYAQENVIRIIGRSYKIQWEIKTIYQKVDKFLNKKVKTQPTNTKFNILKQVQKMQIISTCVF